MLGSPFNFEELITPAEFQKLGELAMRWSLIDHILGNCLKTMLRLSDEEAVVSVFPLGFEGRLKQINALSKINKLNNDAMNALAALNDTATHIQTVRNIAIHGVIIDDEEIGMVLHLRSKRRSITLKQALSIEEITNYIARAALSLRYALGISENPDAWLPLPEKPELPKFLNHPNPIGIRLGPRRKPPPRSSPL